MSPANANKSKQANKQSEDTEEDSSAKRRLTYNDVDFDAFDISLVLYKDPYDKVVKRSQSRRDARSLSN